MGALGVYRSRFPSPDVVVGEETWLIDKDGSRQQFRSAIPIGLHHQSEYSHRDQADSAGSGFALGAAELVRRGTVMPVIATDRLDVGNLTSTVWLVGFLRL
jgi:hypothetical protein